YRQHRAGLDRLAVHQHRTRAALAGVAADVGARQAEGFAQVVNEEQARLDLAAPLDVVDRDRNRVAHAMPPAAWFARGKIYHRVTRSLRSPSSPTRKTPR